MHDRTVPYCTAIKGYSNHIGVRDKMLRCIMNDKSSFHRKHCNNNRQLLVDCGVTIFRRTYVLTVKETIILIDNYQKHRIVILII